jgi:hypothetical protein
MTKEEIDALRAKAKVRSAAACCVCMYVCVYLYDQGGDRV